MPGSIGCHAAGSAGIGPAGAVEGGRRQTSVMAAPLGHLGSHLRQHSRLLLITGAVVAPLAEPHQPGFVAWPVPRPEERSRLAVDLERGWQRRNSG
jgi:hypothetical protein